MTSKNAELYTDSVIHYINMTEKSEIYFRKIRRSQFVMKNVEVILLQASNHVHRGPCILYLSFSLWIPQSSLLTLVQRKQTNFGKPVHRSS